MQHLLRLKHGRKTCHGGKIWIVQVPHAQAAYVSLSEWPFPCTIWPHSIFINIHVNVLTVSLTQCHISNSVLQYTAVTNGFHINCQKIEREMFFLKNSYVPPCLIQFYHSILSDLFIIANVTCANVTERYSVLDMSR